MAPSLQRGLLLGIGVTHARNDRNADTTMFEKVSVALIATRKQ